MSKSELGQLMRLPVSELPVSDAFRRACLSMEFDCLENILICVPGELLAKKGFSYAWLMELTDLLEGEGILHLLQPMPGRSSF